MVMLITTLNAKHLEPRRTIAFA